MGIELPEHVRDQLEELGEPLREFKGGRLMAVLFLGFGLVGVPLGVLFITYALMMLFGVIEKKYGEQDDAWKVVFELGAVFILGGVALVWRGWTKKGLHVYVMRKGLAKVRGREVRTLFWRDVAAVLRVI